MTALDAEVGGRTGTGPARTGTGPARPARFPCFDGLRAVAALTVVGVHTAFESGLTTRHPGIGRYTSRLEIGVEVFFVISGFLLYRPFAAAHFGIGRQPARREFWIRRLKRIIPAYWVAFLVVHFILQADTGPRTWDAPIIYMGFAQIYIPEYALHGLTQAWSLCTEMSFYLAVPFYAALLARRRRAPDAQLRAELTGLALLTFFSFAWRIPALSFPYGVARTMPNWLPGYMDQFALGMLLAVVSAWLVAVDRRPGWLWHPALPWVSWALAAAAFWAVSNIGLTLLPGQAAPVGPSLARQTLYGLFAFFLVVPAVFGAQNRGWVRLLLRSRPVALIGVVSYGIYLWHEVWMAMFFRWTGDHLFTPPMWELTAAVLALSIASATVSYRLIERPILRTGAGKQPDALPRWVRTARQLTGARS